MFVLVIAIPLYLAFAGWVFYLGQTELAAALFGAFVGWFPTVSWDIHKERTRTLRLRKAILDEMKANRRLLIQKRDIIEKVLKALEDGKILRATGVPFLTMMYETHLKDISESLESVEYVSLTVVHTSLQTYDAQLAAFDQRCDSLLPRQDGMQHLILSELPRMKGLRDHSVVLAEIMDAHIAGTPKDLIHSDIPLGALNHVQFR